MNKEVESDWIKTGKLFLVYILPAMIFAGAVVYFVGMRFHNQPVASSEASPVPPGWTFHKGDFQDDPRILAYTMLTKGIGSPLRNPENGSLVDERIDITIDVTTSSPEAYIAQMDLSGKSAEATGIQGSWGTFFSDKIITFGVESVILFNGNKAEYFNYTNSADASDFWKVVTYYAQNPAYY